MFIPKRVLIEKNALNYALGKKLYDYFTNQYEIDLIELDKERISGMIPGDTPADFYQEGKKTLVLGVKKGLQFQTCKPSAHYQLPLLSGCTGHCQYCYLNTNLSGKPYIKINVNTEDILEQAGTYIGERLPDITIFEGSATSDPVPVEPYANLLQSAIRYFGDTPNGRFRFVTKYTDVDTLLNINHKGHTEIRFTLNTDYVIRTYESRTPSLDKRLEASVRVIKAGYPTGYLIAPVFFYENWKEDYTRLLEKLREMLPEHSVKTLTFEIISHRYTARAKKVITEIFPENTLPMKEEERNYKYGQFGYGKYVYPKERLKELSNFFQLKFSEIFMGYNIEIKYII